MKIVQLVVAFFAMVLASETALAQLQANLNAKKDNTLIDDAAGAVSNGAGEYLFVGETKSGKLRRGVLAFDIAAALPAAAVIDSVKLKLSMSKTITGPQPVQLFRMLADWGEGTSNAGAEEGAGAPATANDATWIHKFFNTRLWTKAGGDFAATASASQTVGAADFYTWGSTPQMVADVQLWLNTPASNFGWLLLGNENTFPTTKRFDSRENATAANRPVLTVFYHTSTRVGDDKPNSPSVFHLAQNYPNPFSSGGTPAGAAFGNPATTIRFALPTAEQVTLQILDLSGRELETLAAGQFSAGEHRVHWNAAQYAGGIYFYRLRAGNFSATRKLVLLQ